MEDHKRRQEKSRNRQSSGVTEKTRKVSQCQNLAGQFKSEKPNLSYTYFHKELTINVKDASPTFLVNHQTQGGKAVAEELVKYMSKLPNYLERGESRSEKILNFGVLDWSRLEKWQYSQKQEQQKSSRHSLSSDNSSSTFTVGGSSSHSSRGTSCSPAHQRERRPSLQDHLLLSPADVHSRAAKPFQDNLGNLGGVRVNPVDDQTCLRNFPEIKREKTSRKVVDSKTSLPSRALADDVNRAAVMCMKAKTRSQGNEFARRTYTLPKGEVYVSENDRCNKSVKLVPPSAKTDQNSSTFISPEVSAGVSHPIHNSIVPLSCPWPSDAKGHLETKVCSQDAKSTSILPEASQSAHHRDAMGTSPTCACGLNASKAAANEPPQGSKVAAEKRSTSPFCRLGIGTSMISKSFGAKETSSVPQSVAAHMSIRSDIETAVASICQHSSNCDRQNAGSRARSSPLRRLLDPFLKPKASISHHTGQPLQVDFLSSENARRASTGNSKSGIAQPEMEDIRCSPGERRSRPSAFRALLRVAVKNGQPLFTFAVDNEPDILAATMKNLTTSMEDDYSCIYTFFSIQEVKKKNGRWMNQGNNGKGHDYIPNVVAQLKVSGSQFSSLSENGYVEQSFAREFILLAVDLQQSDEQTLAIQASNELAAIMVKVLKVIRRSTFGDVHQTEKISDPAQSLFSTTVVLPSGIHSLPSKGGPSSLIQRWRSGGSCDCGGWDLGCKLKILANNRQHNTRSSSSMSSSPEDKLELILQGGDEDVRPLFRFSPFKDGIYSVEFSSVLSILQAFSICMAVLDGKKLCENPKPLREGRTSLETALPQKQEAKFTSGANKDVPAKFVSNPPLSPVGRV